jgi:DNA-directed RNA polymerase sigma subunit (sigma70/sigma32)
VAPGLLKGLDRRERFIAEHPMMAAPGEALSFAQIARDMNISRERARQLELRAKRKLARSPAISRNSRLNEWLAEWRPALAHAS